MRSFARNRPSKTMPNDLKTLRDLAPFIGNDCPANLRRELGALLLRLEDERLSQRTFAYGGRPHQFVVGTTAAPLPWVSTTPGARALMLATLNPGKWLALRPGRTRRAWHADIHACLASIERVDPPTRHAIAFARARGQPGLRLREHDGAVEICYRPAPNRSLDVSARNAP